MQIGLPMSIARAVPGARRASSFRGGVRLDILVAGGLAVLALLATYLAPTAIWPLTALLFLLGAPHGGVMLKNGVAKLPSAGFIVLYLAVAAIVLGLFVASPLAGLAAFFLLSAWHFSRAEAVAALGIFATFAAFLLSPPQTHALIVDIAGAGRATDLMLLAGELGAVAGFIAVARALWTKPDGDLLLRFAAVVILFALLPPLLAMAIYFFALHSLAEYRAHAGPQPERGAFLFLPVGVPVVIGGAALYLATLVGLVSVPLMAGLALALAIPHMLDEALRPQPQA